MSARKVMLLGEIGVGKSSLARRLVFDKFEFDYKPTIGVDIYRYEAPASATRPATTLIIWDTDGNFGDAIFRHVYMKEAAGALIVGDIARPPTMETMVKLATGFRDAFPGRHHSFIVNKTDLVPDAESAPLLSALTQSGSPLIRTSAKTGSNVERAFIESADVIARRGH
ncbi:MAG: GTP-binding protein [Hyphomicrobiaceae bacterium]